MVAAKLETDADADADAEVDKNGANEDDNEDDNDDRDTEADDGELSAVPDMAFLCWRRVFCSIVCEEVREKKMVFLETGLCRVLVLVFLLTPIRRAGVCRACK